MSGEKRSLSVSLYVGALVITVLIFSFGLLLGMQLSEKAVSQTRQDLEKLKQQTVVLELLAMSENVSTPRFCAFYDSQIQEFSRETDDFRRKLVYLETHGGSPEVPELGREYELMQLRDYLLIQKINSACGKKFVSALYFYSSACPSCKEQGLLLEKMKKDGVSNLMLYYFNTDSDALAVKALSSLYQISSVPSLVVDGTTYSGFQDEQTLSRILS